MAKCGRYWKYSLIAFLNKEINKIILEFAKKAELQIKTNDIKVYDIEKISA